MIVSLNEIENTCHRAALGVGLPQGLAEDAARIGVRLACTHANGLELMLKALRSVEANADRSPPFHRHGNTWRQRPGLVPALIAGPIMADLLAADPRVTIAFDNTDVPEAAAAALATGTVAPRFALDIEASLWAELARLAARTYVPATATSRLMGAGAGLLDND